MRVAKFHEFLDEHSIKTHYKSSLTQNTKKHLVQWKNHPQ